MGSRWAGVEVAEVVLRLRWTVIRAEIVGRTITSQSVSVEPRFIGKTQGKRGFLTTVVGFDR